MISKIAYAEQMLNKVPAIPTNKIEFKLINQIISDLEGLHIVKDRSDARITLLNTRIKFIEDEINLQKKITISFYFINNFLFVLFNLY